MDTATRDDKRDPVGTTSLGQKLLDEHVRLATLCQRVIAAFEDGDRAECDAAFRELERDLEQHLQFEERELLPRFAHLHPEVVAEILAEHALIRSRLTELGVGVDLHLARCTAVKKLVVDLGDHARREGQTLYRWADRTIDEPTRAAWLARRFPV